MSEWKPIKTAATLERVIVSGWQPPSGNVAGYWWVHEDVTDNYGFPVEHPNALYWHPMPDRPDFPSPVRPIAETTPMTDKAPQKPDAWMRRWAFDGIDVMKIKKADRPRSWQCLDVTRAKVATDDVPLFVAVNAHDELVAALRKIDATTRRNIKPGAIISSVQSQVNDILAKLEKSP